MRLGVELAVWVLALASAIAGMIVATDMPRDRLRAAALASHATPAPRDRRLPLDDSVAIHSAPFRADRMRPRADYSPYLDPAIDTVASPQRPSWRIAGVLRGAEFVALVEGLSGSGPRTRLVRVHDRLGDYRVQAISADSVTVTAGDSTWTLRLEAPWR